ncbi:MAG: hypothetical protein IKK29_01735, partial [Christensenellaceae bacterium]|nr:hypothetical protein [Christensenellaceae bacterium]
ENEQKAEELLRSVEQEILALIEGYQSDILLFVAKPAPVVRLDGKARYHILLKVLRNKRTKEIRQKLYDIWECNNKKGVQVSFDIDPNDVN